MAERRPVREGFYRVELCSTEWEVPDRYQTLKPLGSGSFGQVCSAVDSLTKQKKAIKKLARPFQTHEHAKRAYRELRMLKHMQHDNIICLLDVFTPDQSLQDFNDVYLVTPLMDCDLHNIIRTQVLGDSHIQLLLYQILRALKYLTSTGIIHRDLKPSNIAVNENCDLKILDFGLARTKEDKMTGYVVARWWRAPEIMLNWMCYNEKVDIWSVGCILGEMLTGKVIFPGSDHIDQLTRIWDLVGKPGPKLLEEIPSEEAKRYIAHLPEQTKKDFYSVFKGCNPKAIDLLERMLDLDPATRISAEEALMHPYLEDFHDPEDEPVSGVFDQAFEGKNLTIPEWKSHVYEEVVNFEPRQMDIS